MRWRGSGAALSDVRNAGRAHARAVAARPPPRSGRGFNPALDRFVGPVLARCLRDKIRIIGNFGAANPRCGCGAHPGDGARAGAARRRAWQSWKATTSPGTLSAEKLAARETGGSILRGATEIIAANLYLGAEPIARALDQGADIVVTGRVADSALALGPLIHAFGWRSDDWDRLAAGTLAGHLLECGSADHRRIFRRSALSRTCPEWPISAIRSPRSMPTAAWSSPSPREPAAASIGSP